MQKKDLAAQQQIPEQPKVDPRRLLVGGNWKSNGNVTFVREMINEVLNRMKFDEKKVDVVVAPIVIHIPSAKAMLNTNIMVCAQNINMMGNGAYTGEVSAEQIKDFGLQWVIIGHSERRKLFSENNEIVAKKVERAQDQGLNSIVCIGETYEEREEGLTKDILKAQLDAIKQSIRDWSKIVIAYEPVWAIGTGKTASSDMAAEVHDYIRKWVAQNCSELISQQTRIIYGGSVTEKNAESLITQKDIDGFLVGGASLKQTFAEIVDIVNKS
ncbi:triosephosphate isomerase [Stylonychia lemnae]|uniref:Triosephosphate isomerase n=1 Tax=Stylonychia lemnae TaxID=5949 RepID=A0A078AFC2_STYLE|nr:triosephosphate isomerase [Stylonychia lemnae]|eukprot:CDW80551.1 triosephosphate isomerase [Stylonychia lemnae]